MVAQTHFNNIKGIRHWATALLLLGIGYSLISLSKIIAPFFSTVLGSMFLIIAGVVYYYALLLFKEVTHKPVQWLYFLVVLCFIGNVYFVNISFNLAAKIVVSSLSSSILLFAGSTLLFEKQHGVCPFSHRLTAIFLAICGSVNGIRAIYYAFWYSQPEQTLLHENLIQTITFLTTPFTIVGVSFGFALMSIDKYFSEKQQGFQRLEKIASRVPGVVYQFKMASDGSFCFPYVSSAIQELYRVTPEEVKTSAEKVFAILHPDDIERVAASIQESAQNLTLWKHEYRIKFADGVEHWLLGNASPERVKDGSVLWHGFITDITERKQTEEALRIKTEEANSFFNTTLDLLCIADIDGHFIRLNPEWEETLVVSPFYSDG